MLINSHLYLYSYNCAIVHHQNGYSQIYLLGLQSQYKIYKMLLPLNAIQITIQTVTETKKMSNDVSKTAEC